MVNDYYVVVSYYHDVIILSIVLVKNYCIVIKNVI
nr:MAG TPA: hypothetical protein [Bacteriophage sp.]